MPNFSVDSSRSFDKSDSLFASRSYQTSKKKEDSLYSFQPFGSVKTVKPAEEHIKVEDHGDTHRSSSFMSPLKESDLKYSGPGSSTMLAKIAKPPGTPVNEYIWFDKPGSSGRDRAGLTLEELRKSDSIPKFELENSGRLSQLHTPKPNLAKSYEKLEIFSTPKTHGAFDFHDRRSFHSDRLAPYLSSRDLNTQSSTDTELYKFLPAVCKNRRYFTIEEKSELTVGEASNSNFTVLGRSINGGFTVYSSYESALEEGFRSCNQDLELVIMKVECSGLCLGLDNVSSLYSVVTPIHIIRFKSP